MEVVLSSFKFEPVECFFVLVGLFVFALLVNSDKHSEILVINLETDCSVGQVLISHREFFDTYIECRRSVFSSWK